MEVTYALPGAIPAGSYHLVADGVINAAPTVAFDVLWRAAGQPDQPIVSFQHQYPTGTTAQYEETKPGPAVAAKAGDLLVFKVSIVGTDANAEFVPIAEHPPTPTARFVTLGVP